MHLLPIATVLTAALSVASASHHHLHRRHSSRPSSDYYPTNTIGYPTGISGAAYPSGTGNNHHHHHHHRNTTLITKHSTPYGSSDYPATTDNNPEVTDQAAGDETCTVTKTVKGKVVTHTVTVYETLGEPTGTSKRSFIDQPSDTVPTSTTDTVLTSTTDPAPPPESSEPAVDAAAFQKKQVKTTTPSTSPSPSPAPPSGSGTGKRGLAFNDVNLANSFGGSGSQISWGYNWGNSCGGKLKSGFMFIPMLWGLAGEKTGGWVQAANTAIAAGSKYLLAFNEPDLPAQANLSPKDAADGYITWMQPFAGKAKLGAPAVTNGGSPYGMTWLKSFLEKCSGCTIDFVPIHWYDSATNIEYFKNYVKQAHDTSGKQIWITEFAGSGSQDQQIAFLKAVMPWLDAQPYVERYAYFGVFDGSLVNGGSPSPLGSTFSSYTGS
ncbi:MAG: hypothetical protein M1840_008337 [Geoglossum simile]|nr:MAG: hypothetical protein M1840_008337 [Geoglossum simile]